MSDFNYDCLDNINKMTETLRTLYHEFNILSDNEVLNYIREKKGVESAKDYQQGMKKSLEKKFEDIESLLNYISANVESLKDKTWKTVFNYGETNESNEYAKPKWK